MFHAFDRDHNHSLDEHEIAELLRILTGMTGPEAYAKTEQLLAVYDTDRSRSLEHAEFHAAVFADRQLWVALLDHKSAGRR